MAHLQQTLPTSSILEEVLKLETVKQIKVSVNSSIKYGALVGLTTMISGILAGPVGLAAGGILSSCATGLMSQGQFKSAANILRYETTSEEKEKLAKLIRELLISKHIKTICDFILTIENNSELQMSIVNLILGFVTAELHRVIIKQ